MTHFFFDLDGTLTESRQEISDEMLSLLEALQERPVIISGAQISQMVKQLRNVKAVLLSQNGNHSPLGSNKLSDEQKQAIMQWISERVEYSDDMIEDRGCQISLSMTGHNAPLEEKASYDPDGVKRKRLLGVPIPGIQIAIAGTTCLDFMIKNKGQNLKKFIEDVGWNPKDCLYIGDKLFPGGNDESVIGVMPTFSVKSPADTLAFLC